MRGLQDFILLCALTGFAVCDLHRRSVPNTALAAVTVLWAVTAVLLCAEDPAGGAALAAQGAAGAMMAGGIFFICYLLSRGRLGGADVKLAAVAGLYLGAERTAPVMLTGMMIALFACFIRFLIRILRRAEGESKEGVPLAPFFLLGTIAYMVKSVV